MQAVESLIRAVTFGIANGKRNIIADLAPLKELINAADSAEARAVAAESDAEECRKRWAVEENERRELGDALRDHKIRTQYISGKLVAFPDENHEAWVKMRAAEKRMAVLEKAIVDLDAELDNFFASECDRNIDKDTIVFPLVQYGVSLARFDEVVQRARATTDASTAGGTT